jgi:hypothetical protein
MLKNNSFLHRREFAEIVCEQFGFFDTRGEKQIGGCYQAANWILVGKTKGRGRQDRFTTAALSVKEISDITSIEASERRDVLVAITGSALANGTMEELLALFTTSDVIVNGGSASIYPAALFQRGVRNIATIVRHRQRRGPNAVDPKNSDATAVKTRWIHLWPR